MRFREQRGGLVESLETTVDIEPTRQAICDHINGLKMVGIPVITPRMLSITQSNYDPRVKWHTCWVHIRGMGVFGCIDHETGELL